MSKRNFTNSQQAKPEKPRPDFPLFPHATKRWAKKIRGQLHYFGPWADPDGALAKYLERKDALYSGVTPADTSDALTVFRLVGKFLTTKKRLKEAGELSVHSYRDYERVGKLLVKAFRRNRLVANLRPDDFERLRTSMAKRLGPVKLGNEINRIRVVFNYAFKNRLIPSPMVYGEGFRRPSKKTLRKHRAEQGPRMFEAKEIRDMLAKAKQPLKSMILLGVNCGYGNSDIGNLPMSALDLERGWITFPRPKTSIVRRCPLWEETIASLREWLIFRPSPQKDEHKGLVFLTAKGDSWAKQTSDNPLSKEIAKLLKGLKINGHRSFYSLRHTFQTVGDEARDFIVVRRIMGHASSDIADEYRENVSDARLLAVTDFVRRWVLETPKDDEGADEPEKNRAAPNSADKKNERPALKLYSA